MSDFFSFIGFSALVYTVSVQFYIASYLSSWCQSWVTDKELEQKVKELKERVKRATGAREST